jgi:hypothetical protein
MKIKTNNCEQEIFMLRNLSTLESFYIDNEINIVTVSDLTGSINALILQKAINTVLMMHPLLSSEVLESEQGYYFSTRAMVDDKLKMIGEVDKDARKQIILDELNKPLEKNSLTRFILLLEERVGLLKSQDISLVMTTHHAVSDGISCVALLEQIWKLYADILNNQSPENEPFPLMPAIEELVPAEFTEDELAEYIERYAETAKQFQPFTITPAEQGDMPVEIALVRKKFTLKQTRALLENCEAHNVSVHGAICAANLLAMRDIFSTDGKIDLGCHSPINVRSRLVPAIPDNAMFSAAVGCVHYQHITAETTLWTLAENVSGTIKNHIANGDIFKSILTYKETRLKSKLATSIGISNVGVIDVSQRFHKLKLESINFIPRIPLPMLSACVATSGERLTIIYPYAKPFYSTNVIKKIAEQATNYLLLS